MNSYIDNLNWRYATKKFDTSKKVSQGDLDNLLEATSLSASSYGLQPYEILVVEDAALRAKLQPAAWGQSQITEASHLIVLANQSTFGESKLMPLSESAKATWTARQTYIALGNLLSAAADLKIDTCPMEGFDSAQFNEMLGLSKKGLNAAVLVAIGYRSEEDKTQHYKKVRKTKENLITYI